MPVIKPQEPSPKEKLLAALAARKAAVAELEHDVTKIKLATEAVKAAVLGWEPDEDFDPIKEPILYGLTDLARRKNAEAARLLLEPRQKLRLFQRSPQELPLPAVECSINGVPMVVPRGRSLQVPESLAGLLEQSGHLG